MDKSPKALKIRREIITKFGGSRVCYNAYYKALEEHDAVIVHLTSPIWRTGRYGLPYNQYGCYMTDIKTGKKTYY